jgi:hypothetical protein
VHPVERRVRACGQRDERRRLGALDCGGRPQFCSVQIEVVAHGELLTMPRGAREREGFKADANGPGAMLEGQG